MAGVATTPKRERLERHAFQDAEIDSIYLLSDGSPSAVSPFSALMNRAQLSLALMANGCGWKLIGNWWEQVP